MTGRLVHVEWEDACSVDPWTDVDALTHEPKTCRACGIVTRETDRAITLSVSVTNENQACCSLVIPRRAILKVSDLTVGEEISLSP